MNETIYTTWVKRDNHWVNDMLQGWRRSNKTELCFPWIFFNVYTLPTPPFWMYFYYAKGRSDVQSLKGKFEFRTRVVSWRPTPKYQGDDIHIVRDNEEGKAWFLCDQFEEIVKDGGELLSLSDFNHAHGKNLISSIRNSIPDVVLNVKIRVVQHYP